MYVDLVDDLCSRSNDFFSNNRDAPQMTIIHSFSLSLSLSLSLTFYLFTGLVIFLSRYTESRDSEHSSMSEAQKLNPSVSLTLFRQCTLAEVNAFQQYITYYTYRLFCLI
jgi:hypothetical protein